MGTHMSRDAKTILLTRPKGAAKSFASQLRSAGFTGRILQSPVLEIVATDKAVDFTDVQAVIFTSRQAVALAPSGTLTAWCVGEQTARDAKAKGWAAKSAKGDVDSLFQQICAEAPEGKILHLCGADTRGELVPRLQAKSIDAVRMVLYRQVRQRLSEEALARLKGEKNLVVPLFSPNSARYFLEQMPEGASPIVVAMSSAIKEELQESEGLRVIQAPDVSASAMIKIILGL